MTLAEIYAMLKQTGYPVAYHHFTTAPTPPYIVYLIPYSPNFMAEDKVYAKINHLQVELYTTKKDASAEGKLEEIFDTNDICYEKTETYIDTEKLYQIIYEFEELGE